MTFIDRTDAGQSLAQKVERFIESELPSERNNIVVVGLPKGGVCVALEVARRLLLPVDILVSRKLPYPNKPELAIGAVSSDGLMVLNTELPNNRPWIRYIESQRKELLHHTKEIERKLYSLANRIPTSFKDKVVIIVDDGIATGMTALAAIKTAKARGAKRVLLAVPVVSTASLDLLNACCDAVITVSVLDYLVSVNKHYLNFRPTPEDEVLGAMRESLSFVA